MEKRPRGLYLVLLGVLSTLLLISALSAYADRGTGLVVRSSPDFTLEMVAGDATSLVLDLRLKDYRFEAVEADGERRYRLQIRGMELDQSPGRPELPTLGVLIGIASSKGLELEILDVEMETFPGYRPPLASRYVPSPLLIWDEGSTLPEMTLQEIPSGAAPRSVPPAAPTQPALLGEVGYIREQAVVPLRIYPAQYDATQDELRVYRRLRIRVRWQALAERSGARPVENNPAFEALLARTLVNYPVLPRSEPALSGFRDAKAPARLDGPGASTPALKMEVAEDGLYRLTYTDLRDAGFPLDSLDPRDLRIQNRGREIPIYVAGEEDGVFDTTDYILFYGESVKGSRYTERNVYWLTAGDSPGKRMAVRDGSPGGAPLATAFSTTLHLEEDRVYWGTIPDGAWKDHWFWSGVLREGKTFSTTVRLENLADTAPVALRVQMHGFTEDPQVDPDHRTRILLNGVEVSDQRWDGRVIYTQTVSAFPPNVLVEGDNVIEIQNVGGTGASVDQFLVNWIEITYQDRYVAEQDRLVFAGPDTGPYTFEVRNFSTSDIWTLDISDPMAPVLITGTVIGPENGAYRVRFQDDTSPETTYLAQTSAQLRRPPTVQLDRPSTWRTPNHRADYIIITHRAFISDVQPLADYHRAQGRQVVVVDVEDLYDEFTDGLFDPRAIRDFLAYAYNSWQKPAPTYVLLVGGATIDYKDNLGWSRTNWVPTQMVDTGEFGERLSDNWFVQIQGDDLLPDMFIGRLPAQSRDEVQNMVDKVLDYAQNPPDASWNNSLLLVADDDESTFEAISENLARRVPYYFSTTRVYVRNYSPGSPPTPTDDILAAIDQGALLVNYTGHGNLDTWAVWNGGRTFEASDVARLNNLHRLPVVTVGNCLNGYFAWKEVSTAEAFLRAPHRGAVAMWAPSGLDYPAGHNTLLTAFYDAIFRDDLYALGQATTVAKIVTYTSNAFWANLVKTYILFSDPATQLGLPTNYPYIAEAEPGVDATEVSVDLEIRLAFNKPVTVTDIALRDALGTSVSLDRVDVSVDRTSVTYRPTSSLAHSRTYTLTVAGTDRRGNLLRDGPVPREFAFTTTQDNDPPRLVDLRTATGLTADVPLTSTLELRFSEPIREESLRYTLLPSQSGALLWDDDSRRAVFVPLPAFAPSTTYTFQVTQALDRAGNPLAEPGELIFTTAERRVFLYLPFTTRSD